MSLDPFLLLLHYIWIIPAFFENIVLQLPAGGKERIFSCAVFGHKNTP